MYNPRSTSPLPRGEPYRHVSVSPNSLGILSPSEQKSSMQFDLTAEAYRQALRTVMQGGGGASKRVSPPRSYSRSRSPVRAPAYKSPLAPPHVEVIEPVAVPPTPPQQVREQKVQPPPPPSPKTTAVQTEAIPEPEPIIIHPSPIRGDRAELQRRLLEIDSKLESERENIQKSLNHIADLDNEKSSIEQTLIAMLDNDSRLPVVDEERRILEAALFESRQEIANLKQREGEYDGTLNDLRSQLAEAIRCLMEEKSRNEELQRKPPAGSPSRQGYPVVGMELGEGAPYKIPGVWVVSVIEGGPAAKAGVLPGDVLTEVAGVAVRTRAAFRDVMSEIDPPQQGHQHVMSFRLIREVDGTNINKAVMVTMGWSSRKPEGRRTVTVQLSPRLGNRSPSPPKIKERSSTPNRN